MGRYVLPDNLIISFGDSGSIAIDPKVMLLFDYLGTIIHLKRCPRMLQENRLENEMILDWHFTFPSFKTSLGT